MQRLSDLHYAVEAVCPITGVSGDLTKDRTTWTFDPYNATPEQIAAAKEVIALFDPVAVPRIVPDEISDRQFFQQLALGGIITQAEALAAVKTGTMPAALQALIEALPADQRFGAQMIVSGATIFQRHHPMTDAIGASYGWKPEQIDTFFIAASAL